MVTHSSILLWKIPWREETDGPRRVRHDLSVRSASAFALQRFAAEDFKNDFLVLFLYSPIVTFSAAFLHLVSLQIFEMVSSQIFQRMQN